MRRYVEVTFKKGQYFYGGDCPKTKVGLSNCTKNECKNNWKTFEKGEILQKNCAECTSANEFLDSLGEGESFVIA